jgi:segregation and condensation protein A
MSMLSYQVSLDVYEGPLELLLRLIERQELDITRVSLALVADQYLAHIDAARQASAANMADFLVIAARLLVLKSRVLLPKVEEDDEEEEEWETELIDRLREYKRFKEVAAQLGEIEKMGLRAYPRVAPPPRLEPRLEPGQASLTELLAAFRRALDAHPPSPTVDRIVAPVTVHIADCIAGILSHIRDSSRVRFTSLMRRARSRLEVIVTFLALLELIKQQRVAATQEHPFGEIVIEGREPTLDAEIPPMDLSEYGDG